MVKNLSGFVSQSISGRYGSVCSYPSLLGVRVDALLPRFPPFLLRLPFGKIWTSCSCSLFVIARITINVIVIFWNTGKNRRKIPRAKLAKNSHSRWNGETRQIITPATHRVKMKCDMTNGGITISPAAARFLMRGIWQIDHMTDIPRITLPIFSNPAPHSLLIFCVFIAKSVL